MVDRWCRGSEDSPPNSGSSSDDSVRHDEVLSALSRSERRCVLHYLRDEGRASLSDVAERLGAWADERPIDDVPDERIADIETALYHHHLPKLREANIVEYDDRSRTIVFRDPPELVEICLDHCAERDLPG